MSFDPRTIGATVYDALQGLRGNLAAEKEIVKQQKSQAVELYSYLSTWGMLRLKAEEKALSQEGKKQVVEKFFECLGTLAEQPNLVGEKGLVTIKELPTSAYLGLTGLGLAIAQEFSFWTTAIYHDVSGDDG